MKLEEQLSLEAMPLEKRLSLVSAFERSTDVGYVLGVATGLAFVISFWLVFDYKCPNFYKI